MKSKNLGLIVVLVVLLVLGGCGCSGYNGLVNQDETVKKAWNNVQSEYQRRYDLVDQLVATVKGAANFEQETLNQVISARSKASQVTIDPTNITPEKLAQFQQNQGELSGALNRLLVTVERYPELKATQNFLQLQGSLEQIENSIRNSRNNFNTAVNDYNVKVRSFPMNILAGIFGFKSKEGFAADQDAQKAPKVDFSK